MSIIKGKTNVVAGFGGTKRPLGEVYFSQSSLATDNLGALPGWTGEYYENGKTLFPDLYNFVKAHSELQVTHEQYDNAIATYGECTKYVVDENTAQTSLRLPKYARSHGVVIKEKKPTDTDPTWYRLYSDGWLEQGGITGIVADYKTATITLPLQFLDTHYTVSYANWRAGTVDDGTWNSAAVLNNSTKSTASFQIYSRGETDGGKIFTWRACGQGANGSQENTLYPWISAYTSAIPASTAQAAEFIQTVSEMQTSKLDKAASNNFIGFVDTTAGISITLPYTATSNGWICCTWNGDNAYSSGALAIDGVNVFYHLSSARDGRDSYWGNTALIPIRTGQVVTSTGTVPPNGNKLFFPFKNY